MRNFWLAVQFLTRLPTPDLKDFQSSELGGAVNYFPVVGLIIGVVLASISLLNFWLPAEVVAGFILAVWIWITGALHLDGLADTADGWLGGVGDHGRALEIMKDSRIGTGGGVALVLILLLKWSVLTYLVELNLWWVLLLAPIIARVASIGLLLVTKYVSSQGIAEPMLGNLNRSIIYLWSALTLATVLAVDIWLLIALVFLWLWVRWIMIRITGGMTGDTAGAMTELMEYFVMLGFLMVYIQQP